MAINNVIMYGGVQYSSTPSTASSVPYVNTTSGLTATNTQSAIDELSSKIGSKVVPITSTAYNALVSAGTVVTDTMYAVSGASNGTFGGPIELTLAEYNNLSAAAKLNTLYYVKDYTTGKTNAELAAAQLKVKKVRYTILTSSSVDSSVTKGYNGSVSIIADEPSGTVLARWCVQNGFNGYQSAGATVSLVGENACYVTSPIASVYVIATVFWLYI